MAHILKQHIGYWINRLRMEVHQSFEHRLNAYDVTIAQWCILASLYDQQATSVNELASYIEVDKASVSRVVERLVVKGLVSHSQGKDRRSGYLELTAEGQKLVPSLINEAEQNEQSFFGQLTTTESVQFRNLVRKILTTLPSITLDEWLVPKE